MATPQEFIRNFMSVLDTTSASGFAAMDEAVRRTTTFSSWQSVVDSMYRDCQSYNGNGQAFLKEKCGIVLNNVDTGAITGADAGGGVIKTAESVVPENTSEWLMPTNNSTTYEAFGLTVNWPNLGTLNEAQRRIVSGLYTWWIPESLELIRNSYGFTFNEPGTTVNTISSVNFEYENDSTLAYVSYRYNSYTGKSDSLNLTINMKYYSDVSGTDVNGKSQEGFLLDRVIAHEMTHAAMAANINHFAELSHYFKEGAAELVHGIDDDRYYSISSLASNPSNLYKVLNNKNEELQYGVHDYSGGYMALRYLAYQSSEYPAGAAPAPEDPQPVIPSQSTPVPEDSDNDTAIKVTQPGEYWLSGYDPTSGMRVTSYPKAVTVDASSASGELILAGNSNANLLKGGRGQTSLWGGGASNDTMQGGSGRDMFWFGGGDGRDVVQSFASGAGGDVLNLYSGSLASVTRSGNNLSLKMADGGSLTVNTNGGSDTVVLYSGDATHIGGAKIGQSSGANKFSYTESAVFYQGGSGKDTLTASGADDKLIWLDGSHGRSYSSIEIIDGSESSGYDQLAGSAASELIIGGKGEVSSWGGAGSAADTLQAGTGTDFLFYGYGEGNDVIQKTTANDRVMLYNMNLSHVAGADIGESDVRITTTAGQTLVVQGEAGFALGDGSTWRADHKNKQWQAG